VAWRRGWGGARVAVFRTFDGMLHALADRDPFTGRNVLARGIVGSRGAATTVASPLHKQVFDLATGQCLDEPSRRVDVYPVRVRDGMVEVAV
jgi:nitrite reductase (NADH) small subunit